MRDPRRISLAWFREALDEQRRFLGDDPWAYEFERNRAALETMIRYSHEQGMIGRMFAPEDLFVRSTLETLPTYVLARRWTASFAGPAPCQAGESG